MAAVRWAFLSDLHFGERNSILSDPVGPGLHAPLEPNDGFLGLVECLHDVARANPEGTSLRLVLLGDVFELALAPHHVALEGFVRFVGALFPEDGSSRIDPRIVFVPGNHDHDLWTSTRDEQLARRLERGEGHVGPTPPVTPVFELLGAADGAPAEPLRSSMLTRLLRTRLPRRGDLEVQVAYPNLGILSDDRALLAHHGHFTDDVYLLMSTISRSVFGGESIADIAQLEADNGPWIDFVWSSLGREGTIAAGLRRSYDLLQSESGKILLSSRLASAFVRRPRNRFGRRLLQRMALAPMIRLLDALERTDVRSSLPTTERVPDDVLGYLDGPLALAADRELEALGRAPSRITFVYGHTHRPLAQTASLPRTGRQAAILNCGGWVVDSQHPRPATGGGMVLVGEDLDAVLVCLAPQVLEPHLERVAVRQAEGAEPGALHRHVAARVERADGPWKRAAAALGSAVLRRRAEHAARLMGEVAQLHGIERMALRTEYVWKLLLRRQARAARELKTLFLGEGERSVRTPPVLRDRSPIALPSGTHQR